jgi:hypothetical protein
MTIPLLSNDPKPPPPLAIQGPLDPFFEPNRIPLLQLHHIRPPRISPTMAFGFHHPGPLGSHSFVPTITDCHLNNPKVPGSIAPTSSASGIWLQEKAGINLELLMPGRERNEVSCVSHSVSRHAQGEEEATGKKGKAMMCQIVHIQ